MTRLDHMSSELIVNLKAGQKKAFGELFELYGSKIYRFALAYLKCKPDAEELMQDVFLKVWENRQNLDPSRNVKAYIFKIAVNCVYDFIRKKNIEKAFLDCTKENFLPGAKSLWHEVIWNDMLSRLNDLVMKMPEQRQLIFLLSREEGLSNGEIAKKLNLSKRTVENQLYRATQYLREHFNTDTLFLFLFSFCIHSFAFFQILVNTSI